MSKKSARKAAVEVMTKNSFERIYLSLLAMIVGTHVVITFQEVGVENISTFVTVYGVFAVAPVLMSILLGVGTFVVEVSGDE